MNIQECSKNELVHQIESRDEEIAELHKWALFWEARAGLWREYAKSKRKDVIRLHDQNEYLRDVNQKTCDELVGLRAQELLQLGDIAQLMNDIAEIKQRLTEYEKSADGRRMQPKVNLLGGIEQDNND